MAIDAVLPENTTVTEPILEDNPNRFVLFPISTTTSGPSTRNPRPASGRRRKSTCRPTWWTGPRSNNERYFIKHILAFFAASDGIVNENLGERG